MILLASTLFVVTKGAQADVQTPAVAGPLDSSNPAKPALEKSTGSSILLQGSVRKEVIGALSQLKDIGTAEEKIKRASEDLYKESMRPQVTMEQEPELIGETVIELPMPVESGLLLPPRKKWVDRFLDELEKLIPMLKEEVDELSFPAEYKAEGIPLFNYLLAAVNIIDHHFQNLQELCQEEPYNQRAMAEESVVIHTAIKDMELARRRLYHTIKEPVKS